MEFLLNLAQEAEKQASIEQNRELLLKMWESLIGTQGLIFALIIGFGLFISYNNIKIRKELKKIRENPEN
jgi:hypothetical protein